MVLLLPEGDLIMTTRSCGDCSACCHTFAVEEIDKARHSGCTNQTIKGGCSIYATRPESCRKFKCAWLSGELEAPERPDQAGFISYVPAPYQWRKGHKTIVVIESSEGETTEARRRAHVQLLHQLGFPLVHLHSLATKPEIEWHINAAVEGVEAVWEDLVDSGYAVHLTRVA